MSLQDLVDDLAAELRVPGLAVAVVHGDTDELACAGVTSVADPLAVTPETLFFIGSTTKVLTVTAVLALVEQGRLDLDQPVRDLVPQLVTAQPDVAAEVRVRHLLNHTAGWRGDDPALPGWGDDALARITEVIATSPQEAPLGSQVSYNNNAVVLAGHLVATVTGQTYEAALTDLVLHPLGMAGTWLTPWDVAQRRLAVGHLVTADVTTPVPGWPLTRMLIPSGGALSTIADQVRLMRWHLDGGAGPLSDAGRLGMQALTASCRSGITGVGQGWLLDHWGEVGLVTHGGNVSNLQTSSLTLAPSLRLGVTVLTNSKHGRAIGDRVLAWAMDRAGVPARVPLAARPFTPDLVADYEGTYDLGAWSWVVERSGDGLRIRRELPPGLPAELYELFAAAPTELVLVDDDVVADAADPAARLADFGRDVHGRVVWVRHGFRVTRKVT